MPWIRPQPVRSRRHDRLTVLSMLVVYACSSFGAPFASGPCGLPTAACCCGTAAQQAGTCCCGKAATQVLSECCGPRTVAAACCSETAGRAAAKSEQTPREPALTDCDCGDEPVEGVIALTDPRLTGEPVGFTGFVGSAPLLPPRNSVGANPSYVPLTPPPERLAA